jgi:uncharacterized protein YjbI with pentapeptide repeats
MTNANLSNANLKSATLLGVNLSSANLSSANLFSVNLNYVNLSNANLRSSVIMNCTGYKDLICDEADFENASIYDQAFLEYLKRLFEIKLFCAQ